MSQVYILSRFACNVHIKFLQSCYDLPDSSTFMPEMVNVGQDLIVSGEEKESINDNMLEAHLKEPCSTNFV